MKKYDELSDADQNKVSAFLDALKFTSTKTDTNFILSFIYLILMVGIGMSISLMGAMLTIRSVGLGLTMINIGIYFVTASIVLFIILLIAILFVKERMDKELYLIFGIKNLSKDIFEISKSDLKNLKMNWRKRR